MNKKHQQNRWKNLPSEYNDLKDFVIDLSDFIKLDVLGKGSFGTVWKAQHISNGWIVAIKEFSIISNKSQGSSSSSSINDDQPSSFTEDDFFREVRILSKCTNNPFLIQLVGFSIRNTYAIVTSFVPCGSLWDVLHPKNSNAYEGNPNNNQESQNNNQQSLNDTQKNIIALGISYAMKYLHSQNIIHLDFKSPNILLDDRILPKVADFGLSKFYDPNSKSNKDDISITSEKAGPPPCISQKGTPMWMSPEQICGLKCDPKSDVYSFGVILYDLYTNKEPYQGLNHVQIFYKVVRSNERPKLPENETPLAHLIASCWDSDPSMRPTFSEIFELFQSGKVKFPFCKPHSVREALRIIKNNDRTIREALKRDAGVLNQAISMRQARLQLDGSGGCGIESQKSSRYFASCAARLAGQGKVAELDVLACSIPSIDFNMPGEDGVTPITAAIANDQLVTVQFFVRLHRSLLSIQNPAETAASNSRQFCLKQNINNSIINTPINNTNFDNPNKQNNICINTPINNTNNSNSSNSVTNTNSINCVGKITSLVTFCPSFNINARDSDGNTPFLIAVIMFRPRIVAYLAQVRSVDVNVQNIHGLSALHLAVRLNFGRDSDGRRLVMLRALAYASRLRVDLKDPNGKEAFDGNRSLLEEFLRRQEECRKEGV